MTFGLRFVWVNEELPGGGAVAVYDSRGDIAVLLHRPAFAADPAGFMRSLERHLDATVRGHGWALSIAV